MFNSPKTRKHKLYNLTWTSGHHIVCILNMQACQMQERRMSRQFNTHITLFNTPMNRMLPNILRLVVVRCSSSSGVSGPSFLSNAVNQNQSINVNYQSTIIIIIINLL